MKNDIFWNFFETEAFPKLAKRKKSMRYVFEHLGSLQRPVFVVETGCVRKENNWKGDGQSTILFDLFVKGVPNSVFHSVDIDLETTAVCKTRVSSATQVHTGDSIAFLHNLARNPPQNFSHLDVLYLDSLDVDFENPHLSALHHLKELTAAAKLIGPDTLVVVDDAPSEGVFVQNSNKPRFINKITVSGKGKYIADYASDVGAKLVFSGYQAGWIGF